MSMKQGKTTVDAERAQVATGGRTRRRSLLKTTLALGVAAATVGAGAQFGTNSGVASAATGGAMILGQTNVANAGTQVKWNGPPGFTGVLLLGNDTSFPDSGAFFPAATGGFAGGGPAGVANGVYGFTQASPTSSTTPNGVVGLATQGTGVLGQTQSASSFALGVSGISPHGIGVSGTSTFGTGVVGSGNFEGVVGKATGSNGDGVVGTGASTGVSGTGTGPSGFGVSGRGSIGVTGTSSATAGIGAQGIAFGPGGRGVVGSSTQGDGVAGFASGATNAAVSASNPTGVGLRVRGSVQIQGSAAGEVTLPAGATTQTVSAAAATAQSQVLLTPLQDPGARLWISGRAAGGFTISASQPVPAAVTIQYLVIN